MAKLRLGVIGAGSWAVSSHLPNFAKRSDDIEFVGVCRKGPALLQKIKDDWGFQVASEDYTDILDAGVDIVLVASPTVHHFEHARAALQSGAHVLVEKPYTIRPGDAWELTHTAQSLGRHLLVAYGFNYRPMVLQSRSMLAEAGGIGDIENLMIYMASVTRALLSNTGPYPKASPRSVPEQTTWTDPAVSGGGYAQAQLTHALGLALWLTGLRGEEVYAVASAPLQAPVELHNSAVIHYTNGAIGAMCGGASHENAAGNREQLQVRAIGADGQFQLEVDRDRFAMFRPPDTERVVDFPPGSGMYDCDGPPATLVDLALGKDVENNSPGELGARTVEILHALYASATTGRPSRIVEEPE